ncbi:branched-chain amino acid ABC transporter permease/ATP-binding protein [Nocardioides sp. BP30]|uniref:branched-chain amino acid ABC transporter permease/ATP-binding protein n=1 Tax=Nocardioides sp. BP30 TaxID=3036374 RepID=UPI0024688D92|nr:branched-chain amino acid ABC transporter permease/ATP-binding protein [Nocardioides sp. BP30]WGL54043.1 branched-chain amino acid ABC transporter permease/ATP-binding protein [Nocardioides sp. BP30]
MATHLTFLLLGLGNGAVYAAMAIALVTTFRSSGVVNFSTGAIALYVAYTYGFLRQGQLIDPIPWTPVTVDLGGPLGTAPALIAALVVAALIGLILYALVFRPLRNASPVAKAVASIGLMLMVQSLLAARVGTSPVAVAPFLPTGTVKLGGASIAADRLWFAGIIVLVALVLGALIRYTRFGLATRAVAESERAALVSGLSPDRIAAINWALSCVVAGLSGILIAPIVPLVPSSYALFIVPALAAALVGGFSRLGPAVAAGLGIGMLQSEATYLQSSAAHFPKAGVDSMIPLVVILLVLLVRNGGIPQRATVAQRSLGRAPVPRHPALALAIGAVVGIAALALTSGNWRAAVITTMILAVLALSYVVVTGYAGQISLAQLALAGGSAFLLARLTTHAGVPFPLAPILSALAVTVLGVIVGLPALRLRGLPVAVLTLAFSFAVEQFWFNNPQLNGGMGGAPIKKPTLFGLDLGIGAGAGYPRMGFGLLCLVVLLLTGLGVALLRRSRLGASMLAVRANERSAAASGIDVNRVKIAAFAIGAFVAGIGGALMGYQQQLAAANSYSTLAGVAIFATVYLAGVSSVLGGVTAGAIGSGGVVFFALNKWISLDSYFAVISGLLLVLTVIRYPEGVTGPLHEAMRRWRTRRQEPVASGALMAAASEMAEHSPRELGGTILQVDAVGVRYGGVVALDEVSFEVRDGEILGLIGPNGAGKTTLLDALSGFAPHATGQIALEGNAVHGARPHRRVRAGLGRTFQGIELYEDLTVEENVRVGTSGTAARTRLSAPELDRLFEVLGLAPFVDRPVAELSHGQRQLVSVARALAGRPRVVLLDEPAAGLDSNESLWLGERLKAVRDAGTTIVMIDHDMGLVLETCDRIVVLDLGRKIADAVPEQIRTDPTVVAAYLGSVHDEPPHPEPTHPEPTRHHDPDEVIA